MTKRRAILYGMGATGALGAAGIYRLAPSFWQRLPAETLRSIGQPRLRPNPKQWPDRGLHVAWLGHATVLIRVDGFTILTDPIFSDKAGFHAGPFSLGIKRLVAPAIRRDELPHVDLVVVSHAHMDHFDIPSLRSLQSPATHVVTAHATSDLLRPARYAGVRELRWGDEFRLGPVTARAVEVNHWGARLRTDTWRGYNGYVIEAGRYRILFGGDTAVTSAFQALHSRRGFDVAVMPIGAYNPWIRAHCTPEQAWRMSNDANASLILPIHHQTFALSREPRLEPIERLKAVAGSDFQRIAVTEIGQELHLS